MPPSKSKREPTRTCPFCRTRMVELPDRVILSTASKEKAESRKPTTARLSFTLMEQMKEQVRFPTRAEVCEGCGFVALFEV